MKILFDFGHPAHVHLFKNFIKYLKDRSHEVYVTARDKDLTTTLLEHYKIDYTVISKPNKGLWGMAKELIGRDIKLFKLHKKVGFDVAFGTSISIAHITGLYGIRSYCFADDDDNVVPFYSYLTYPFATKIINPEGTKFTNWKNKRVLYKSYQKLAYLHPNNFQPDKEILNKYGLEPYKYVVIRNSSLQAHHDFGAQGINIDLWNQIKELASDYKVIYSKENNKDYQIEPWDIHHILAFAKLLLSDSQSMTVEASVLGVPNIRYNSFAGKISCLEELEKKYQLTLSFKPGEEKELIETLKRILADTNLNAKWTINREKMLKDKEDMNMWLINYFEKSIKTL